MDLPAPIEALNRSSSTYRITSLIPGLPRRSSNTRRSNSRGEQILTNNAVNVKPLSRRSVSAGVRKLRRWLNDHLVFARTLYTYEYDPQNHEQEFLDRLEHMLIQLPPHNSPLMRLSEDADLLRYFRHGGAEGFSTSAASLSSTAASTELTVQSLLSKMYRRIHVSLRPNLLKETRRASQLLISSSHLTYRPLVTEAEILMLRLLDQSIITALEMVHPEKTTNNNDDNITTTANQETIELWKSLLDLGEELEGALASPMRLCSIDVETTIPSSSSSSSVSSVVTVKGIELPLIDGYARMLIRGIASFYGVRVDSYVEPISSTTVGKRDKYVVKTLQLYVPPSVTKASKIERAAVSMVRQQLADVWKNDLETLRNSNKNNANTSSTSDATIDSDEPVQAPSPVALSSSAAAISAPLASSSAIASSSGSSSLPSDHPFAQLEPLVPLYALHVRTIDNNQRNLSQKNNVLKPKFSYGKQYLRRDNEEDEEEDTEGRTYAKDSTSLRTESTRTTKVTLKCIGLKV